jgi:hypothetical protein
MNTWARKSFKVGVLSAGALLFAGTAANAATLTSIGNSGLGSGNQTNTELQAPIDICGNAIGGGGNSAAGCLGGSWADMGSDNTVLNSFGNSGVGSGNQTNTITQAPIDICGNAVGGAGNTWAHCIGGSLATSGGSITPLYGTAAKSSSHHQSSTESAHVTEAGHVTESSTLTSVGNSGAGSGNQTNTTLQIPIDICGNAIGGLGNAQAACVGGASANSTDGGSTTMISGFNAGIASGNQTNSLIQVPIDICGNAIGGLGNAEAACVGGSSATTGGSSSGGGGGYTGGGYTGGSYVGGTQGTSTNESVNASKSMHFHHVLATPNSGSNASNGSQTVLTSIGNSGAGSGNQTNTVTQIPIEISGNAIGLGGNAEAWSFGGAWASN